MRLPRRRAMASLPSNGVNVIGLWRTAPSANAFIITPTSLDSTPRRKSLRSCMFDAPLSADLALRPEVDGPIAPARERPDEVLGRPDVRLELRRAEADEAHEMRVAAAERGVAVPRDQLLHAVVLALAAAAVERLDGDHALERRLRLVVGAQADVRPAGMARERDAPETRHLADELLRRKPHVGEVEARQDVRVHTVDEHVAVVGLHLGGREDAEPVRVLERAV